MAAQGGRALSQKGRARRIRRYANHATGRKYAGGGGELPVDPDPVKAESASIFRAYWQKVEEDPAYQRAKADHKARFG